MSVLVEGLAVEYRGGHTVRALDGVDLEITGGEIVGIVGESGSGKSTLGLAIGRLLPRNAGRVAGDLSVDGRSVWSASSDQLRQLRSRQLGFVFQSPMASLDPTIRVGRQLAMQLADHGIAAEVATHLRQVGLDDVERVARAYPHELSGGMAQRVAIAIALAPSPQFIVADEPTASLDSTVRALVMSVLVDNARARGTALMLLSHDLQTIRQVCDRVVVMYGGRVVEDGSVAEVLDEPEHPYTRALMRAIPGLERPGEPILAIDGMPPTLDGACPGCSFAARCGEADERCRVERPRAVLAGQHTVLCHRRAEHVTHPQEAAS